MINVPFLMSTAWLPQRDHIEDKPVYECLLKLLAARNAQLLALLPQLLVVFGKIIPDNSGVAPEIRSAVVCVQQLGPTPAVAMHLKNVEVDCVSLGVAGGSCCGAHGIGT